MSSNKLCQIINARIKSGKSKASIARSMGIHINTVYKAWRAYKEQGTTNDALRTGRPVGEVRRAMIESVKGIVKENPNRLIRGLARELTVSPTTMRRVVREDLGLKSLAVIQVQQLTPLQIEKRLLMATHMLNRIKGADFCKNLIVSDEKDFHLNKHLNRRNHRTLAPSTKDVEPRNRYQGRPKFPKKAMFFGYVGSDGTAFPGLWIEGTLDGPKYKQMLIRQVLPTLDRTYGKNNFIWVQDGAPCYTAKTVLSYLQSKLGSKEFWSRGVLPPNSCKPESPDFSVWEHIDSRANNVYNSNINAMKFAAEREFNTMSRDYVRATYGEFRSKLEACIAAQGGIFEK